MTPASIRFTVWVSEYSYETVVVDRALITEVRDAGRGVLDRDPLHHSTVVTKGATYVVQGGMHETAERIWPTPPSCEKCGRPL